MICYFIITVIFFLTLQIKQKEIKYLLFLLIICLLGFEIFGQLKCKNEVQSEKTFIANIIKSDKKRFIAHAGGEIEGNRYTNSLEAMNLNYSKGFKLFELDIIKILDGFFVAAHDWKHWAKKVDYKGKLPPNKQIFLQQKIQKKYTPMDLKAINEWFKTHSDAILVTDKVNLPKAFSSKFIDKKRLMMELFTWDAVKEGLDLKIKSSMPTGRLLFQIKGDKIKFLKKLSITDIATSHRLINNHKNLMKQIVRAGINFYAFHLNFKGNKDEKDVLCGEHLYFYGIYADKWNFREPLNC